MSKKIDISLVIPAYNEEGNVYPLYNELKRVFSNIKESYEIIFVDDGSTDRTYGILNKIQKKDKKVKAIRFQRNFGKAEALSAGFSQSKGTYIITIDADLQDDPREIPRFIKEIQKGYDLVVGWRHKRKDPMPKIVSSKLFNLLVRTLTKIKLHDSDCNFRAIRSRFIKELNLYGGLYRYIPSIAVSKGFSVNEIKVAHHKRKHGKSKYGITRLFGGFMDLITIKFLITYNKRPLHLFGGIGAFLTLIGVILASYLTFLRLLLGQMIGQRPLLLLAVLLIVLGIQLVSIGLVGEMIANTSKEKRYIIKK